MREQPDLTDEFEQAIENHGYAGGDLEKIEKRECASDNNDGVEYKFYGHYVPIRPIIDVAAKTDGFAIEEMSLNDQGPDARLIVFVADIRTKQPHPAFTDERL